MFLRYRAKYYNEQKQKIELGFFKAADYLQKQATFTVANANRLDQLVHWFDHNLPIPEYYQDERNRQLAKSATSWFKDSSTEFISLMNELCDILEANNVEVERIFAKKLYGKKIYEDDFQVTIDPFRDVADQVK